MRILIESTGHVLAHNELLDSLWRYDLVPVPLTLEFKIQVNDNTKSLKEGELILITDDDVPMRIIKEFKTDSDLVQDGKFLSYRSFIAVLDGCERLIEPSKKAILLDSPNFSEAYRACGVKFPFESDISLHEFHAFYGKVPSFEIARRLCEEAAVIQFKNKKLNAIRLNELKKKPAIIEINGRQVEWEQNPQIEKSLIKSYITVNPDGTTIEESLKDNQAAGFYPGMDSRRLKNLRTVLVRRGSVMRQLSPNIIAGDVVNVDQVPYIVLTAAHRYMSGTGGDSGIMATRIWIAEVSTS